MTRTKLSRAWWGARAELEAFVLHFATRLPGITGVRLRHLLLKRQMVRLGAGTVLQTGVRISSPDKVAVGENCNFAQGAFITGGGGVTIGNWVGMGPDAKVWSVNHRFEDPDVPWILQGWEKKPVVIEDDVWLGANVFVMPGVTIGRGAVVSAGAVVNKSIPAYALVAGNPGRVVGWRKTPESATDNGSPQGTPPAVATGR